MRLFTIILTLFGLFFSTPASAFGLRVHLYIAEQIYNELDDKNCQLSLTGKSVSAPADVCAAIMANKGAFLAGAIGPDVFPDILIGQTFVHPGIPNGKQTADWLDHLLAGANTPKEIAFAYGNMIHAAGDVFAHSYVNNYAGAEFEITKKRSKDVELRHFKLEKYIDQNLKYEPPTNILTVPASLLVEQMVKASYSPGKSPLTTRDLIEIIENPTSKASKALKKRLSVSGPAGHMKTMKLFLDISNAAKTTTPCEEIESLTNMINSLQAYQRLEEEARLHPNAVVTPMMQPAVPEFNKDDCRNSNQDLYRLTLETTFENTLAVKFTDFSSIRREDWWDRLPIDMRQNLLQASANFKSTVNSREQARAMRIFASQWHDDIYSAVEEYIELGVDTAAIMVANSSASPPAIYEKRSSSLGYKNWFDCYSLVFSGQPASAAREHCERLNSLGTDISLARAATYSGIGVVPRNIVFRYLSFKRWLDNALTRVLYGTGRLLSPNLTALIYAVDNPKPVTKGELDRLFRKGGIGQLSFLCVSDWVDRDLGMLARSEWDQNSNIREDFPCERTNDGQYLERSSHLDPEKFVALQHAITMGKLALLNQAGLQQLVPNEDLVMGDYVRYSVILDTVRSLDGAYQWHSAAMPYPRKKRYKRPPKLKQNGYPYLSEDGRNCTAQNSEIKCRPGFPFYANYGLRSSVFSALFSEPFEGEILRRREFQPDLYPFKPCDGDPFRPQSTFATFSLCQN